MNIGIARQQPSRSFQVSRGLSHAFLGQKRTSQIVISVGIVRLRLQRDIELGDGVVQLVLEKERKAIVKPGKRIFRVKPNRLAEPFGSLFELAVFEQGGGLVIVRFGQRRILLAPALELGRIYQGGRLAGASRIPQGPGQHQAGGFVARKQPDGPLKFYNGLVELTLPAEHESQVPVSLSRARVDADGLSQFGLGCRPIILLEGQ